MEGFSFYNPVEWVALWIAVAIMFVIFGYPIYLIMGSYTNKLKEKGSINYLKWKKYRGLWASILPILILTFALSSPSETETFGIWHILYAVIVLPICYGSVMLLINKIMDLRGKEKPIFLGNKLMGKTQKQYTIEAIKDVLRTKDIQQYVSNTLAVTSKSPEELMSAYGGVLSKLDKIHYSMYGLKQGFTDIHESTLFRKYGDDVELVYLTLYSNDDINLRVTEQFILDTNKLFTFMLEDLHEIKASAVTSLANIIDDKNLSFTDRMKALEDERK